MVSPAGSPAAASSDEDEALAIDFGRWLFAQECRFVHGSTKLDNLPEPELDEIAFAGRSNVGKSSLINALTGRNTLARTSQTPGRTQQINFFSLADALMLIDLPGYGYARASKTKIAAWTALVQDYLRGRPTLRRLCLLIDARHGIKAADHELMSMLDVAAVSYQIVLTKADKADDETLAKVLENVAADCAIHVAAHPEILVTSAKTGHGIGTLRAAVAALVDPNELSYSPPP